MRAADLLFFALASVALAASAAAALQAPLRRAAACTLAAALALAAVQGLAGAAGIAALQAAFAATGAVLFLLEPSWMDGEDGGRAKALRVAAAPALAWLLLAAGIVLRTRWPVEASLAPPWPSPGLLHHLLLALLLLAVALASAASRRSVRGAALALPPAGGAAATMFVALSRFSPVGEAASLLAALATAASWVLFFAVLALGGRDEEGTALPPLFATGVSLATCGVALALLAGNW